MSLFSLIPPPSCFYSENSNHLNQTSDHGISLLKTYHYTLKFKELWQQKPCMTWPFLFTDHKFTAFISLFPTTGAIFLSIPSTGWLWLTRAPLHGLFSPGLCRQVCLLSGFPLNINPLQRSSMTTPYKEESPHHSLIGHPLLIICVFLDYLICVCFTKLELNVNCTLTVILSVPTSVPDSH